MKKNNKTLGLLFVVAIMASCVKGGNNDDLPNGSQLLLVESKMNDKISARYDYDSQNRLIKLYTHDDAGAHQTNVTYTYNNNGQLTAVEMVNVEGEVEYTETYTYGDGNRPTSSKTIFDPRDTENAITTTYSYSTNKVIEKTDIPGGYISEVTYTTNDKENLLSIETSSQGQWVSTTEFANYDNKHAAGKIGNPYSWKFNSPNNYQSEKTTTSFDAGNRDRIFKYTYNNDGYPTKMEIYNRTDNALVETHTYSYKTAN